MNSTLIMVDLDKAVLDELNKWDWQELYLPIHFNENIIKVVPFVNPQETVTEFADRCRECGAKYGKLLKQEPKTGWNNHQIACMLADLFGDACACNYNGIDEWLGELCDFKDTCCPNPVGVACWEQFLKYSQSRYTECGYEVRDKNALQEPKTRQFAEWVAREIFDDMWEYNKDAFAEIACRKLAKLGIVRAKGDEWELVEPQESEDKE